MPTELGQRLATSGLSIRVAEDRAMKHAGMAVRGAAGELRLGAPPIIAAGALSSAVSRFLAERPECTVELRVGLVDELRQMPERAQIDLVVAPKQLAEEIDGSVFLPIMDDRVGVLCRAGHPLLHRKRVTIDSLSGYRWIAHSRGSMLCRQTENALLAMGVATLSIAVETDSIQSVLEIVARTDLFSTMTRESTRPYLNEEVGFLTLDHPRLHRLIGAVHRHDPVSGQTACRAARRE